MPLRHQGRSYLVQVSAPRKSKADDRPIAAVAEWRCRGEMGRRQVLAVKPGQSPELAALGGNKQRGSGKSWLEVEIDDAPVAFDGVN
jgi:hypothetical protein